MKKSKSPNEMLQECIKDMSDNSWLFVKTPGRDFSRKGKLPLKGRESVLKRLREYQEELSSQKGQAAVSQEAPELQERKKT